jgi:gamma-glutamylcyclotransferase (GGCT)/AIG2-like uncharacterized protein YtfP
MAMTTEELAEFYNEHKDECMRLYYHDMSTPITLEDLVDLLRMHVHVHENVKLAGIAQLKIRLDTQERINGRLRELLDNHEKRIDALEQIAMPKLNDVKIQEQAKKAVDKYFKYFYGQSKWTKYIEELNWSNICCYYHAE